MLLKSTIIIFQWQVWNFLVERKFWPLLRKCSKEIWEISWSPNNYYVCDSCKLKAQATDSIVVGKVSKVFKLLWNSRGELDLFYIGSSGKGLGNVNFFVVDELFIVGLWAVEDDWWVCIVIYLVHWQAWNIMAYEMSRKWWESSPILYKVVLWILLRVILFLCQSNKKITNHH